MGGGKRGVEGQASPMTPWFLAEVSGNTGEERIIIIISDPNIPQHQTIGMQTLGLRESRFAARKLYRSDVGRISITTPNTCCFDYSVPSPAPTMLPFKLLGQ